MSDAVGQETDLLVPRQDIDEVLCKWLNDIESPTFFLVVGPPGSGKTSWSKLLIQRGLLTTADDRPFAKVVANHFCRRTDASSSSAFTFIERVSAQIAGAEPAYAQALLRSASRREKKVEVSSIQTLHDSPGATAIGVNIQQLVVSGGSAADAVGPYLVDPLREAVVGDGPFWLILVDGLDEAERGFESGGVKRLLLSLGTLPRRVRVVVTTRPDRDLERELDRLGARHLDLGSGQVDLEPLKTYIGLRLASTATADRISPDLTPDNLVQAILDRAGGSFLVARCAIDMLAEAEAPLGRDAVRALPSELTEYYLHFMSRLSAVAFGEVWPTQAAPILGALAVAREPLSEEQLSAICRLSRGIVRGVLVKLRPYLEPTDPQARMAWRLYHQTLAEFLTDAERAEEFWLSAKEEHAKFVRWALGGDGTAPTWPDVDDYILKNIIFHVAAAGEKERVAQMEEILSPKYLSARLARDDRSYRLVADLDLCVEAARADEDLERLLAFTILRGLWVGHAAHRAQITHSVILAAMGRLEDAMRLAQQEDDDKVTLGDEAYWRRCTFAMDLAELGEVDSAIIFADRIKKEIRTPINLWICSVVAPKNPIQALDFVAANPLDSFGQPQLSAETCQFLARTPKGVEPAWACAGESPEHRTAVAVGCASHDLDRALKLAEQVKSFSQYIGGESVQIGRDNIIARLLAANVDADLSRAQFAWQEADERLGNLWPSLDGLPLAASFARAHPELGIAAFDRLNIKGRFFLGVLAATYLGARSAPSLFPSLITRVSSEKTLRTMEESDLEDVCALLDVLDLATFLRASEIEAPFVKLFAEQLLAFLFDNHGHAKYKSQAEKSLGQFFALIDDDCVRSFAKLVTASRAKVMWGERNDDSGAVGVAIGLAERSTKAYIRGLNESILPDLGHHRPIAAAAHVIALRDPTDALQLIDHVEPMYDATRAELCRIVAKQMRLQGRGHLEELSRKLSPYVEGSEFQYVITQFSEIARTLEKTAAASHPAFRARAMVRSAVGGGDPSLLRQAYPLFAEIASLSVVDGEVIWTPDLQREMYSALLDCDPDFALTIISRDAKLNDLRIVASRVLSTNRTLSNASALIAYLKAKCAESDFPSWRESQQWNLALAFALELSGDSQAQFLAKLRALDGPTYMALSAVIEAQHDPLSVLTRLASGDLTAPATEWAAHYGIEFLAARDPNRAIEMLKKVAADTWGAPDLLSDLARGWPLQDWRGGIDAIERFREDEGGPRRSIEILIERAAVIDPGAVEEFAKGLPNDPLKIRILERVIVAAAMSAPAHKELWPRLASLAATVDGLDPHLALFMGIRRLERSARKRAVCEVISGIASGSRQLFLRNMGGILGAAIETDPSLAGKMGALAVRLRSLLEV